MRKLSLLLSVVLVLGLFVGGCAAPAAPAGAAAEQPAATGESPAAEQHPPAR